MARSDRFNRMRKPGRSPSAEKGCTGRSRLRQPRNGSRAAPGSRGAPNGFSATRPAVPAGLGEYFLPADWGVSQSAAAANLSPAVPLSPEGLVYRPALLAQVQVRYLSARYSLDYTRRLAALLTGLEGSILRWEEHAWRVYPLEALQSQPLPQARFAVLPGWLADARRMSALQRDFSDWVYRSGTIKLRANPTLKVFSSPEAIRWPIFASSAARSPGPVCRPSWKN